MTTFTFASIRTFGSRVLIVCALFGAAVMAQPAQSQPAGITVSAIGESEAKPDVLVFEGTLTESAERAEDAVVAFRDSRRRALASLEALGVEGLTLETRGLRVSRAGEMGGGMGMVIGPGGMQEEPAMPGQTAISQTVAVHIPGLADMSEEDIVDLIVEVSAAAKEAGIAIGGATQEDMMMQQMMGRGVSSSDLAAFRVTEPEQAQQEAAESAMAQARQKAERLAALAGVELGRVVAITEGQPAAAEDSPGYLELIWGMAGGGEEQDPMSTTALEPVTVRTVLTVTFAIKDAE